MTKIKIAADLNHYKNDQMNRVYDVSGIAPTLLVVSGGGREIKIMEGENNMDALKVNDLFCGAGGMGLGFKNAGFEIAGAWDFDKHAVQSYKHNIGEHVKEADIGQMAASDLPYSDVWTFGFPCQDLSLAGKRAGLFEGKRSGLFFEVMRLLGETNEYDKPAIIMAENVKGLKPYIDVLWEEYEQQGYKMYYTLYNSKYWGVPQNRERYFVVGVHESIEQEFIFPEQQEYYIPRLITALDGNVDEKYYLSIEKTNVIIEQAADKLKVKQATKKGYDEAQAGDLINIAHPNSKTCRGRIGKQIAQTLITKYEEQVIVEGYPTTKDGSALCCVSRYYKGTTPKMMAKGHDTHVIENGLRVRRLTPREYARLQGFPDNYEQVVSDSQFYKQMGNAVTVNVAQAIAERIKMFLHSL